MEDEPVHTDEHPFCDNPACWCHEDETLIAEVAAQVEGGLLTPEEAVCEQEMRRERQAHLRLALSCLTKRERAALLLAYGLDEQEEARSLAQVGRLLGLSRERVRQLIAAALAKLRRSPLCPLVD
jgi:RNA polymerase sigma factor (sigma-70 family)